VLLLFRFGKTALHFAVTNNSTDCLKLLLDYGADVHSIEELGRTPLWVAASEDGHHGAIVCLLEAGADVNLRDRREKRTPLHVRRYADEMVLLLYIVCFQIPSNCCLIYLFKRRKTVSE